MAGASSIDPEAYRLMRSGQFAAALPLAELAQHARANLLYRRAVELEPTAPRYCHNLACSERSFGRLSIEAICCVRSCGVQTPGHDHIEELQKLDDGMRHSQERKALERRRRRGARPLSGCYQFP